MGNCQAIDSATSVIQHPNGKVDRLYLPIAANEIMKMNPGHYVALLLTTTLYSSSAAAEGSTTTTRTKNRSSVNSNNTTPLRITKIKLLRPTDTLALGHVYRLVTYQEVMKGLLAKKQGKMKQPLSDFAEKYGKVADKQLTSADFEAIIEKTDENMAKKTRQVKQERHRSGNNNNNNNNNNYNNTAANSSVNKSRAWQPSLKSISEAGG